MARRPAARRGYLSNGPGVEADVLSCSHCQFQIELVAAKGCDRPTVDRCPQCAKAICERCGKAFAQSLKCIPFEQRLEKLEASARLQRAIGLA